MEAAYERYYRMNPASLGMPFPSMDDLIAVSHETVSSSERFPDRDIHGLA